MTSDISDIGEIMIIGLTVKRRESLCVTTKTMKQQTHLTVMHIR